MLIGSGPRAAAAAGGAGLARAPGAVAPERLHVVVQKGRLFQQEHPDVPVLRRQGPLPAGRPRPGAARQRCGRGDPASMRALAACPRRSRTAWSSRRASPRPRRAGRRPCGAGAGRPVSRASSRPICRARRVPTRFSTSAALSRPPRSVGGKLVGARLRRLAPDDQRRTGAEHERRSHARAAPGRRRAGWCWSPRTSTRSTMRAAPTAPAPGADDDGSGSAGVSRSPARSRPRGPSRPRA